jgi:hypothetical protein
MSKALTNAIASLLASGKTKQEISDLVEEAFSSTFVTWQNVRDHLSDLVDLMPGWVVLDRESATIQNQNGQQVWFGSAVSGGLNVCQKKVWCPPGFSVRFPIEIHELAKRIQKLDLSPSQS